MPPTCKSVSIIFYVAILVPQVEGGVVAEWLFDRTWNDASGNGNQLTPEQMRFRTDPWGGLTYVTRRAAGGRDPCIRPTNQKRELHLNGETTLSMWVKPSYTTAQQVLFSWTRGQTGSTFLELAISSEIFLRSSKVNKIVTVTQDDDWLYLLFFINPATSTIIVEVNGVRKGSYNYGLRSFQPSSFTIGCRKTGRWLQQQRNQFSILGQTSLYGYTMLDGPYPCSHGAYYGGGCHFLTPTATTYDPSECSSVEASAHPFAVLSPLDDMFANLRSSLSTSATWSGLIFDISGDWEWQDGSAFNYNTVWCGDSKHLVSQWRGAGRACQRFVRPSTSSVECTIFDYTTGAGLIDEACTETHLHFCTYDPLSIITTAPATSSPLTPFPDTNAPLTPAPVTPFPDTVAPPTTAPDTTAPDTDAPNTTAPATPFPDTDAPPTLAPDTGAPATPFPDTNAPDTTAPVTPFPDTAAPATSVPPTNAPNTDAPATPFPGTVSPPTPAPDTLPPSTLVPGTTAAPPTPFPDTAIPTNAPATAAPATPFPDTNAPFTAAPATPFPATVAPATPFPDTNSPPTTAPLTPFPDTSSPATTAPTTPFPDTVVPLTAAPDTKVPDTSAPATPFPKTAVPATFPPATSAPATPFPDTQAPSTVAPPTQAPTSLPTGIPTTSAPPTFSPSTAVPTTTPTSHPTAAPDTFPPTAVPTSAPTTSAPSTLAPSTAVPGTFSPLTQQPVTAVPTTVPVTSPPTQAPKEEAVLTPPTPSPGKVIPASEKSLVAGGATGAAVAAGTGGGKLAIVSGMNCEVEDIDLGGGEPLDWEFHPLGIGIGDHAQKYFLGAVVSNLGIVVVFLILNYAIAWVQVAFLQVPLSTAIFYVRAPGLGYIPMMWLLTGTSMAASNLTFFPSRAPAWVSTIGAAVLALCVAFPIVMWFSLLRRGKFQATTVPDPKINEDAAEVVKGFGTADGADETGKMEAGTVYTGWKRTAYILVFGSEVWVRKDGASEYFVERYGLFFEQYRHNFHWFSLVEMVQILALSLSSAWKPRTHGMCMFRNVSITIVLFFYFLAIVTLRPYNSTLDMVTGTILSGLMFVAVLLMAIAIGVGGSAVMMKWAAHLLFFTALVMMFKGAYDLILYCLDVKIGRRWDAVRAARAGNVEKWKAQQPTITELCELSKASWSVDGDQTPGERGGTPDMDVHASTVVLSSRELKNTTTGEDMSRMDMQPLLSLLGRPCMDVEQPVATENKFRNLKRSLTSPVTTRQGRKYATLISM